ncbi:DUF4291 domain-containing protein [Saccharopolyspora sp. NPDC050642]|uniref:DUF4291 domain-containing protein n=1 Tax=Saccharopolyspora sp. NPDC050642 TaxID=3157099 RepID=UPI0033F90135
MKDQENPYRAVRARYSESTITVYQAYSPAIAEAALAAGKFVPPFKRERMTWIKPSFLWMAYRCGWATKPDQERVLAVEITREGFEWALEHACLSHYEPDVHGSREEWAAAKRVSPVRVQWDPERDLHHRPLNYRSVQIGLGGVAVDRYVDDWTASIEDITPLMRKTAELVAAGNLEAAGATLPTERSYPLPEHIGRPLGATS